MDRKLRELRRRGEARLRDLDLSIPFDLEAFCRALARRRGRSLQVHPLATGIAPYGLWLATPAADYVVYEADTSPLHRLHIILHELSHIIYEHRPVPFGDHSAPILSDVFPDFQPDTIRYLLQRTIYSTDEEQEAEVLATLILERIDAAPHIDAPLLELEIAWLRERIAGASDRASDRR